MLSPLIGPSSRVGIAAELEGKMVQILVMSAGERSENLPKPLSRGNEHKSFLDLTGYQKLLYILVDG